MYARFPEGEPWPFSAEQANEIDFAGDRLTLVLYELSGAVIRIPRSGDVGRLVGIVRASRTIHENESLNG